MVKKFSKNPPYDEFGMLPFLDELIGVDWVMDLNEYQFAYDSRGNAMRGIHQDVKVGKLKDPRDRDSTHESRLEFTYAMFAYRRSSKAVYYTDIPNDWSEEEARFYMNSIILDAKLVSLTPPQGYPNAPTYYIPEYLEELYREGKFDIKLDP
ncbi:hypothetical protein CQA53_11995, partial [Helicobacter didelphidarum]